jgi:hypothetical protein
LNNTDFNHTGNCSVHIQFQTAPGITIFGFSVNNVQFVNGNATINFSALNSGITQLAHDINSTLFGTWKDASGTLLTITFASNGITWGGSAGNMLNMTTNAFQGSGYSFAWTANNGGISYRYSHMGGATVTTQVYTYTITDGGNTLNLSPIGGGASIPLTKD